MNNNIKKLLHYSIQIIFLGLFVLFMALGKVQLWMVVFLAGIVMSAFIGRIYCGWVCPINTVTNRITLIKNKCNLKGLRIPNALTKPYVRYIVLGLFVAVFVFTIISGKKLPVLPILFVFAILLALLFPEELWHRYLCPYGTILSCVSKKTRYSMSINTDKCNHCGICIHKCPAKAIIKIEGNEKITKQDCLICMKCEDSCRQNAISYKNIKDK